MALRRFETEGGAVSVGTEAGAFSKPRAHSDSLALRPYNQHRR